MDQVRSDQGITDQGLSRSQLKIEQSRQMDQAPRGKAVRTGVDGIGLARTSQLLRESKPETSFQIGRKQICTPMVSGLRWPGQTSMGSWPPAVLESLWSQAVAHTQGWDPEL